MDLSWYQENEQPYEYSMDELYQSFNVLKPFQYKSFDRNPIKFIFHF